MDVCPADLGLSGSNEDGERALLDLTAGGNSEDTDAARGLEQLELETVSKGAVAVVTERVAVRVRATSGC